jgi:biofilm PGA synthesis N-glycosyltransferase PgaC
LAGSVGVVAGVLGLFGRDAVLEVGGYDGRMATEDIDLSWRLLIAGWHTTFEPHALVGMPVPTTLSALWKQRCRWARGQGEVLNLHLEKVVRRKRRWLWPLGLEPFASLVWALAFGVTIAVRQPRSRCRAARRSATSALRGASRWPSSRRCRPPSPSRSPHLAR